MADQFQTRVPSMREILEGLRSAQTPEDIEAAKQQLEQNVSLARTIEETPVQPKIESMSAYSPSFSYSGPTEEEKAMQAEIYQKLQESMQAQQEQIAALREQAAKEQALQDQAGVLGRIDFRPFAEALRSYGSTTAVVSKEAPQDRTEILRKLNEAISRAQGGLTGDQVALLRAQLSEKAGMRQAGTEQRFMAAKDKDIFKEVKNAFDPILKDYNEFESQASTIRSAVASGEIGRLNSSIAAIARMQGEKGPLNEGDIVRNVPVTYKNKVAELLAKIDDPSYKADPAVLRVIADNIGALEKAAQDKAMGRVTQQKTLYEGAPMSYGHHAASLAEKTGRLLTSKMNKKNTDEKKSLQDMMDEINSLEAKKRAR
jgi:hypothetical protein